MNDLRSARYVRDYVVHLEFDDGLEGDVDLSSYLRKGPIFAPLVELVVLQAIYLGGRNTRLAERSRYRARAALRNDGKCEPRGRANALTVPLSAVAVRSYDNDYYCNPSPTLTKPSANVQIATLYPVAGTLADRR